MAGGRGGKGGTNVPKLKGVNTGARPAGSSMPVPQGQYPTVIGTRGAPNTPAPYVGVPGDVTINSSPAPSARGKRKR